MFVMIDYDQILFADKFELDQIKKKGIAWAIASAWHRLIFTCFNMPIKQKSKFVFFRSLKRDDYKLLFNVIQQTIIARERISIEDFLQPSKNIALKGLLLPLLLLPKLYLFKADSLSDRVYLFLRLCFYYRVLSAVKNNYDFDVIVFFADMQPVENLLAQYFRGKGKKTITLQHGLYVDYKQYETVNCINYLHQPSEYFLAWGRCTKALIETNHPKNEVIICGKPIIGFTGNKVEAHKIVSYISVVLDQNIFLEENILMLDIVYKYARRNNVSVNVRFHPYNKFTDYEKFLDNAVTVSEGELSDSLFVVGHTSSLLYELMCIGVPVVRLATDKPAIQLPKSLEFTNLSSLQLSVNAFSMRNYEFALEGKQYIQYQSNESLQHYKEAFKTISAIK